MPEARAAVQSGMLGVGMKTADGACARQSGTPGADGKSGPSLTPSTGHLDGTCAPRAESAFPNGLPAMDLQAEGDASQPAEARARVGSAAGKALVPVATGARAIPGSRNPASAGGQQSAARSVPHSSSAAADRRQHVRQRRREGRVFEWRRPSR